MIRCYSCKGRHITVLEVKDCHIEYDAQQVQYEVEARAEAAFVRYLEDRGYEDARAQEYFDSMYAF